MDDTVKADPKAVLDVFGARQGLSAAATNVIGKPGSVFLGWTEHDFSEDVDEALCC